MRASRGAILAVLVVVAALSGCGTTAQDIQTVGDEAHSGLGGSSGGATDGASGEASGEDPARESRPETEHESPASDAESRTEAEPPAVAVAIAVEDLLAGLTVAEEQPDGYDRKLFKHWNDADGDGCDTRREVLIGESTVEVAVGPSCTVTGAWLSLYDGVTTDDAGDFDVDHMVPLAEAWESGAHAWSAQMRTEYANDLARPEALIAVSASSNRSKGARDPAEWLPPDASVHCGYAWDWALVKTFWSLTVDQAELDALTRILRDCEPGGLSEG